jgi:hypothetical protein
VSTSWVAGTVRATALARRRVGAAGARELAAAPGLDEALALLARTPYGHDVRVTDTLAAAQQAVGATLLWHLRVLSGWLPRGGTETVRLLAGGFEVANADEHVAGLGGQTAGPSFQLGMLETAWSRLRQARSLSEVQEVLARSPWGDPGAATPWAVHVGMRLAWADRVASGVPEAAVWARAAAALLVLRVTLLDQRPLPETLAARATYLLGPEAVAAVARPAVSLHRVAALLPADVRWVLAGVDRPEDLWRSSVGWWHRVEQDAFGLLHRGGFDRAPVVGAATLLAVDAWRVRAALEAAARTPSAGPAVLEAFDAVA